MRKYMKEYIQNLDAKIEAKKVDKKDIIELEKKILYFQHERFIHLIVTLAFAIFTIIFMVLGMLSYIFLIPFAIFIVVLFFYIVYYFFLENNVQYLYKLDDKLQKILL